MTRLFEAYPARRGPIRLIVGLAGPGGSGKTCSALRLATGMVEVVPGPIVVLDTESGRALHYADRFTFAHVPFEAPFGSDDYREALRAISRLRPSVIIIDSLSHEHEGEGGFLDLHAQELEALAPGDPLPSHRIQQAAWRQPRLARRRLLSALLGVGCHLILCMRANERTRPPREPSEADPVEMGFTPVSGPEFLYELTIGCLLRPGAGGVPTLRSERPGEAIAIKHPVQVEPLIPPGEPLSEAHGAALARWALSDTPEAVAGGWLKAAVAAATGPSERIRRQTGGSTRGKVRSARSAPVDASLPAPLPSARARDRDRDRKGGRA